MTLEQKIRRELHGVPRLEELGNEIIAELKSRSTVSELLDKGEEELKEELKEMRADFEELLIYMGDVGLGIRSVAEVWELARLRAKQHELTVRGLQ